MKLQTYLFVAFLLCAASIFSQSKSTIVDDLNTAKPGQGKVMVYMDDNVKQKIDSPTGTSTGTDNDSILFKPKSTSGTIIKCAGYKVQVFSGNDQRNSKNEAYYKQSQIKNMFPDIETMITYHSPFWRLRAGNFKTHQEAAEALRELKKALPSLGREMYVVRDQISLRVE